MANNSEHNGDHITVGQIEDGRAIAIGRGATAVYQGLSVEEVALLVTELRRVDQPKAWDGRTPYLGLSAFQESDAEFFFGRESLVDDLLLRVTAANFIVIAGPSGSGKSSVARAGLFHALRNGRLPKSDQWRLAIMEPGGDPIEQLALAIERLTHTPGAGNHIRHNGLGDRLALHTQIQTLLSDDPRHRFVLLVDQFEELFTQTKDEAAQVAFIDLLTTAAQTPQSRTIILPAIRADFISHCARYPELRALMSQQFQLVGAMESHDLAKAITLPALEVGAAIDPALVSQIMADMKGEPGALPLMSFALRDLFEVEKTAKGKPMDLTLPEYRQRGGIEMALERHANKVFANFTAEQQALAKIIFSRLIEVGQGRPDTRRTAVLAELVPTGQNADEVAQVIERFAREGARLLTTDKGESEETGASSQTTVTIAHEKLIDAWPWLRQLVDENRAAIALQNQIANDARLWAKEKDPGYLYRGGRLAQVKERLADLQPGLNALSQEFIQACLEAKEAEQRATAERIQKEEALRQERANAGRFRRLTRWLGVAAGVAVIATFIALFFLSQTNSARIISDANAAEVQRLNTFIQTSQLAFAVQGELVRDPERALLVGVAGFGINSQPDIYRQLTNSIQTPYRTTLYGHKSWVQSAVFSPDGKWIVTASSDDTALLWDGVGNKVAVLRGHEDAVLSAEFSPDGQRIVTASADGTARLWEGVGSIAVNELVVLRGHDGRVLSAMFSPNGQRIVTTSDDGTARLWDVAGNELAILRGHEHSVNSAVFSPDGQRIVTASNDSTARLWNESGDELALLRGHESSVLSAAFSPDGQRIVTASWDGTARLWDGAGNEQVVLRGHERGVFSAVFSPDGQTILTASDDRTARLWTVAGAANRNELVVLRGHDGAVMSAVFSPDSQIILTASVDGTARFWDGTGNELAILRGHTRMVTSALFNSDGRRVVTASGDGTVRLWDSLESTVGNGSVVLHGHAAGINSATFSADGQRVVTASDDGTARLWDLVGNELVALRGHRARVSSATFSPNGETILTASWDGTVRLWVATGGEMGNELDILCGHEAAVFSAVFSPDGQIILAASDDGTARLWDTMSGNLVILSGHRNGVNSAVFSPDGQRILTAGNDRTARLWNEVGNELVVMRGHEDSVLSAVFSPDGQRILTASRDGTVRLWDKAGNELSVLRGHQLGVNSAVFSPDERTILTAGDDGTVWLWDVGGNELDILRGHDAAVFSAVFSPDGKTILTASDDGTARLWPNYTVEYMVKEAFWRLQRGFTEAECQQFFRDDLAACPRSKKALFAPLIEYLSPAQQAAWAELEE